MPHLIVSRKDGAVFPEPAVTAGQFIQVAADVVGRQFLLVTGKQFGEGNDLQQELPLQFMGNGKGVRTCPGKFQAGLPEQAGDTHVAIQDINPRVALVGEHLVPVEGVVRLRTLLQVGVLERGNGQLAGDPVQFLCADIRVPLQGKRLAAPAPLRQQFPDLHRAAAPGPEPGLPGLPVIPDFLQYHAIAEMS